MHTHYGDYVDVYGNPCEHGGIIARCHGVLLRWLSLLFPGFSGSRFKVTTDGRKLRVPGESWTTLQYAFPSPPVLAQRRARTR